MTVQPSVLVLAGGPDREREVSLDSARAIADALAAQGFEVHHRVIDRPTLAELASHPGDVVFPALHGPWGEGGPLQELLEQLGRPFVGSGAAAAAIAMDKLATGKLAGQLPGVLVPSQALLDPSMTEPPAHLPLVIKPVADGSSVGVHVCRDAESWTRAHAAASRDSSTRFMVEQFIAGRELTVGLLDGRAMPIVEIVPASGVYDYDAKYQRSDTRYVVKPDLPEGLAGLLAAASEQLSRLIGVRHLARVDFIIDDRQRPWLLELNTMPGFTSHSLLPMAAEAVGIDFATLCARLVELAARDDAPRSTSHERSAARPRSINP